MEPTQNTIPPALHPLSAAAGPLAAALSLAAAHPLLPATIVETRRGALSVFLHDADAASFPDWVAELGLEERVPNAFLFGGQELWGLHASGEFAGTHVEVTAYPSGPSAVAA